MRYGRDRIQNTKAAALSSAFLLLLLPIAHTALSCALRARILSLASSLFRRMVCSCSTNWGLASLPDTSFSTSWD